MSRFDLEIGSIVLAGDRNWRKGFLLTALAAFVFGRRERFTHLGKICTIAWWRGAPYLVGMREARP